MATTGKSSTTFTLMNVLPLLVIPLLVYNLIAFTNAFGYRVLPPNVTACNTTVDGVSAEPATSTCKFTTDQGLASKIFSFNTFSGDVWNVSFGDLFLALSLLLLFVELVKATGTDAKSITNHGLSMLVAVICIIQFFVTPGFSNSVFFLLTLMTLLDVVAGFIITIVAARRDFQTGSAPP
jgi:hypothetical protein